ncbi:MAG: chloride channel protein [Paracoccus sp. (in: a-proteobacteria)]|uniref:chloride channel protein n=1 Tax=Paracoccus sp. TaxID=267 RepID=UPI0026E0E4D9|nr:chloride channel protein [Paracoccus sp. (in: a-proteobacteria)]MDO5632643.1 chloride channel protein [Paracoccus sp. (in: a-proteobacteria)]
MEKAPTAAPDKAPADRSGHMAVAASDDTQGHVSFALAILLTACVAGLVGAACALTLHVVQHLAFGYALGDLWGDESFLDGVRAAAPSRRVVVLALCGVIAGVGWWLLFRFGRPLRSIAQVVDDPAHPMPVGATLVHGGLQIVTVAMGSPVGREVAPREIAAMLGGWLSRRLGLTVADQRTVIACGAGAGLAAIYNVPLGGAVFTLEVLLKTLAPRQAVAALTACTLGAYVAWTGLGDSVAYRIPALVMDRSLVIWAVLTGPVFGLAGLAYGRLTAASRASALTDARMIPACLTVFAAIGIAAIFVPELLGNGHGPIQLGLEGEVGVRLALILIALKLIAVVLVLRAGAEGGLMTPAMTIGALMALILGAGWGALTGAALMPGSYALIGAAALLSVSMKMPLTAVILTMEFTRAAPDFLIPVSLAVAGACVTAAVASCNLGQHMRKGT